MLQLLRVHAEHPRNYTFYLPSFTHIYKNMKVNLPSTRKLDVFTFFFNFFFVVEAFCIRQVYYEPKFELQQHCRLIQLDKQCHLNPQESEIEETVED